MIFNLRVRDENFYYLSGIEEECSGVVLWDGYEKRVIVSELEEGIAKKYVKNLETFRNADELWDILERRLRRAKVIGVNMKKLPAETFRRLRRALKGKKIEDFSKKLEEMRSIKRKEEIEKIKRAGKIAEKVFERTREIIEVGKSEREIAAEVEFIAKKEGAGGFLFPTIVASGENAKKIHANPGERKIKEGDSIIIDFGPAFKLYGVDISRTFFAGRNERFKKVYEKILGVLERAEDMAKEGEACGRLFGIADREIAMKHALGHGVGLEAHEKPFIGKKSRDVLRRGMVFTLEPAEYVNFGIRIEDTYVLEKKAKRIAEIPRDLDFVYIK